MLRPSQTSLTPYNLHRHPEHFYKREGRLWGKGNRFSHNTKPSPPLLERHQWGHYYMYDLKLHWTCNKRKNHYCLIIFYNICRKLLPVTPSFGGHVTPEADEGGEWSGSLHASRQNWITSEWEGSWGRAGMGLHGWMKAYKICLVLPVSTRYILFSVAHSIRTPQLSVLDLEQF